MANSVTKIDKVIGQWDETADKVKVVVFTALSQEPGVAVLQADVKDSDDMKTVVNAALEDLDFDLIP